MPLLFIIIPLLFHYYFIIIICGWNKCFKMCEQVGVYSLLWRQAVFACTTPWSVAIWVFVLVSEHGHQSAFEIGVPSKCCGSCAWHPPTNRRRCRTKREGLADSTREPPNTLLDCLHHSWRDGGLSVYPSPHLVVASSVRIHLPVMNASCVGIKWSIIIPLLFHYYSIILPLLFHCSSTLFH